MPSGLAAKSLLAYLQGDACLGLIAIAFAQRFDSHGCASITSSERLCEDRKCLLSAHCIACLGTQELLVKLGVLLETLP